MKCIQIMLNAGATLDDPVLEALLLDNDVRLRGLLSASSASLSKGLNMLCAFTSCRGVSPLHICAEPQLNPVRPRFAGEWR